jgi:hypothetical protein
MDIHRCTLLFLETCAHTFFDYHHSAGLLAFFFPLFFSRATMVDFLPYWMHLSRNDDDNDNNRVLDWWWRALMTIYKRRSSKKEEDRRRMRLWLFDRARCGSVSYGRIVIVVKVLLLCVNRPWFLSFLCFPSCHSLYLSNRREFIELNESRTSVVF